MPEIEIVGTRVKAYLDGRPNTHRIGIQPGGLWNADGEAVYLRSLQGDPSFMICSEQMAVELIVNKVIEPSDVVNPDRKTPRGAHA